MLALKEPGIFPRGRVAQKVEQRPFKPLVAGSIPATLTMKYLLIFAPIV